MFYCCPMWPVTYDFSCLMYIKVAHHKQNRNPVIKQGSVTNSTWYFWHYHTLYWGLTAWSPGNLWAVWLRHLRSYVGPVHDWKQLRINGATGTELGTKTSLSLFLCVFFLPQLNKMIIREAIGLFHCRNLLTQSLNTFVLSSALFLMFST